MNEKEETPWLTTKEAAEYLRVSVRALHIWVRDGVLKRYQLTSKRVYRYRRAELDELFLGDQDSASAPEEPRASTS